MAVPLNSKRVLIIKLLFFIFQIITNGRASSIIEITSIQMNYESEFVTANATVHSERSGFDMYLHVRKLLTHQVLLNMKLKVKWKSTESYVVLYHWKRIDLCKFLAFYDDSSMFKQFFQINNNLSSIMTCPVQEGFYLLECNLGQNVLPGPMPEGKYKIFLEVVHVNKEMAKTFAMQINMSCGDDEHEK